MRAGRLLPLLIAALVASGLGGCVRVGPGDDTLDEPDFSNLTFQLSSAGETRGKQWELWWAPQGKKRCMALVFPPAPEGPPSEDEFRGAVIGCANPSTQEFPMEVNGIDRADDAGLVFVTGAILENATIAAKELVGPPSVNDGLFVLAVDGDDFSPRPRVTVQQGATRWRCVLEFGDPDPDCRRL